MKKLGRFLKNLDNLLEAILVGFWRGSTKMKMMSLGAVILMAGALWMGTPACWNMDETLSPRDLINRPWIDRIPESNDDFFKLYYFSDEKLDRNHYVGVFLHGNMWKREMELFGYRLDKKRIHFFFPFDRSRAVTDYRNKNGGPRPFDMTLEMFKDPRNKNKKYVYYSREDWGDGSLDAWVAKNLEIKQ